MVNVPLFTPVIGTPGWTCVSCKKSIAQLKRLAASVPSSVSDAVPLNEITSPAWKIRPSVGDRICAVGELPTRTSMGGPTDVLTPSDTDSRVVYCPARLYVCVGFARVDVAESPNVQA